jgi:glycosyltransferase involved in cell wall biosynthesis
MSSTRSADVNASPRVSVIVAAYNAADTLEATLASVAAQTYRDFELIAVDDGSTDATPTLLARFAQTHAWARWIRQDNAGPATARERAITAARGAFIAFIDADDLWLPEKLALQMAKFDCNPSLALVFSDERDFSIDGDASLTRFQQKPPARGRVLPQLFFGNFILNSSVVARKDVLLAIGGFNPAHRVHEGIDLWMRLAEHHDFDYVDAVLVRYRVHTKSLSHANLLACQQRDLEMMDTWMARRPDLFPADCPRIRRRRALIFARMGRTLFSQRDWAGARHAYRCAIALGQRSLGMLARTTVAHLPALARLYWFAKAFRKCVSRGPTENSER